jgi:hypothetical protein
VLGGAALAADLARDRPAAAVIASESPGTARWFCELLARTTLELSESRDVAGVELGGAYKSVVAVTAGLAEALGFGEAARTALVTRGFAELGLVASALKDETISPATLAGPAGLGDLILGCTSARARDWQVGYLLGRGGPLDKTEANRADAAAEIGETIRALGALAAPLDLELPVLDAAHAILAGRRSGHDAVLKLIAPRARRATLVRPSETNLLEMDEIDEGGKALADGAEIEGAKAVQAEVLDTERSQYRSQDHGGANVGRGGGPAVREPAHEAAGKGVPGAGWVDDRLDRERGRGEDAALVEQEGAGVAALDHDGARPEGANHSGGGGQVRKP